ncbi:uncharacterized protein LOC110037666 [Phalaenopsis equestris]|uniref:uncharacterized protein LOC110037666 n=1 Tax=Phalaenopsis equestris TaxID=78828 RepID=UPI0009E5EAE6|nr:uncharacterized protein LOC110037666 [Phalaenopsis equestris]
MDPTFSEKIDAIKKSKNKKELFLLGIIKLMLSVFSIGLFLSSPNWLPSIIPIIKKMEANAFGPKGIFVVCNIIVLILVRESKLSKSSMRPDIHQEYVNRNRNFQKMSCRRYNDEADIMFGKRKGAMEEEEDDGDNDEDDGNEEMEELNKRVEDFIERVKKQRKLEAQLIDLL